jgi:hypothetical protein
MPSHHGERTEARRRPRGTENKKQQANRFFAEPPAAFIYTAPSPAKRHLSSLLLSLTLFLASVSLLLGTATAQHVDDRHPRAPSIALNPHLDLTDPAWKGPSFLVVDKRPAPPPPSMHLLRRDGEAESSSPASKTLGTDPNASSQTAIASPFDTALGNNFTAPCAAWFRSFLHNNSVIDCHPLSLLLQTSSSFFDASKSFARITTTLEATCNINSSECLGVMNNFARAVRDESNCAVDYANDNPSVLQAYNGLVAYQPLYQAGCLRDDSGNYCFANAITNASAVTDSYPYYLPLGVALPGGARPSCSPCLQDTMAIFSSFTGNATQPISRTYNDAAQHMEMYCGPTFVNQSASPLKGAASAPIVPFTGTLSLLIMAVVYWLV